VNFVNADEFSSKATAGKPEVGWRLDENTIAVNLLIAAAVWLLLSNVSPLVIFRSFVGFLAVLSLGMMSILVVFPTLRTSRLSTLWLVGPGLPIGLLLAFLIRWFSNKSIFLVAMGFSLALGIVLALMIVRREKSDYFRGVAKWPTALIRPNEVYLAIGLVSLPLLRSWVWMIPASVAAFAAAIVLSSISLDGIFKWLTPLVVTVAWLISAAYSVSLQSQTWWMLFDDTQLFEAFAHGLVEWGPRSSPVAVANDGLPAGVYHHLVYLFAGVLEWISGSAVYVALTRTTAVFVAASLVGALVLVASQMRRLCGVGNSLNALTLVMVGLVLVSPPIDPDPLSNLLGSSALITATAVSILLTSQVSKWTVGTAICLVMLATAFSKASYLYAAPLILLSVCFVAAARRVTVLISTAICALLLLFFFSSASPQASDLSIDWFNSNSIGELAAGSTFSRILAVVVVFSAISLSSVCAVIIERFTRSSMARALAISLMAVMTIGFVSRLAVGGRIESIRYYWEPALLASGLVILLFACCLVNSLTSKSLSLAIFLGVVTGFVWNLLVPLVIPSLNSGSVIAKSLRFLRSPMSILLVVSFALGLVVLQNRTRYFGERQSRSLAGFSRVPTLPLSIVSATVAATIAGALPLVTEQLNKSRNGLQDLERSSWIGTAELLDLAENIKFITSPDDLLAMSLCEWKPPMYENIYSIAAHTDRRFLSLGGTHVAYYEMTDLVEQDLQLSIELGRDFPEVAASALRARGVDYVILSSRCTSEAWRQALSGPNFVGLYENPSFFLLRVTR